MQLPGLGRMMNFHVVPHTEEGSRLDIYMSRARELLNDLLACEAGPSLAVADLRELQGAAGLAFLFWRKCGAGIAPILGWGFVIRRLHEGTTTVRVADDWDAVATDDESACAGCIHHIRWTAPYFYKFQGVSLGAVAGFVTMHTLIALHTPAHIDFFTRRRLTWGADLAVVDGPRGGVEAPSRLRSARASLRGCRKWHLSNGIAVDCSVPVMLVHRDRKTNAYAYGPNASVQQILAERDGLPAPRECIMLYTDITELID